MGRDLSHLPILNRATETRLGRRPRPRAAHRLPAADAGLRAASLCLHTFIVPSCSAHCAVLSAQLCMVHAVVTCTTHT